MSKIHNTIEQLKKLNEKLPEISKQSMENDKDFWESYHPYTLDDAIQMLKDVEEYIEE